MEARSALVVAIAWILPLVAGCLSGGTEDADGETADGRLPGYDTSRGWSLPLDPPTHEWGDVLKAQVPSFDGTPISVGIFMPKLAEGERVPVVMDSGPYYGASVDRDKYRPPLVEWLVPHGYAVAQMSIRGTGESGGCMEFMSLAEQKDVDHLVTWLAQQEWSNGNVGMMGRSYDGTTPFMAAALGNPHLKTIVPISGVASVPDLMFKNGTSELRGSIMHSVVYWASYGVSPGSDYRQQYLAEQGCEEFRDGTGEGPMTAATGDASSEYWRDREFRDRILENWNGSLWIVHGLEDWNVNPSQVVPWINELQDAGLEVQAWLGQWAHAYPDRMDEHRNVRWDWAQATLEWFDWYLKAQGEKPELSVEVEDSLYVWRAEPSFPPRDATWTPYALGMGTLVPEGDATAGTQILRPHGPIAFTSEPLEDDLRISGLPRFHATVTPTTPAGGYLFAELHDVFPDGRSVRIGWGAIDLRYHAGGNQQPSQLTPGTSVVAKMEFEPMDAHVGEGHRLRLVVHKDGVEDILPSPSPEANVLALGAGSLLKLPVIQREDLLVAYEPLPVG